MEAQEIIATPPAVPLWSSIKEALRTPEGEMVLESLLDRKSTRLNSSHLVISYAVFCLKKKNSQVQILPHASPRQRVDRPPRRRTQVGIVVESTVLRRRAVVVSGGGHCTSSI